MTYRTRHLDNSPCQPGHPSVCSKFTYTEQSRSIEVLNWVTFLFCKLSTISYELFLQNKANLPACPQREFRLLTASKLQNKPIFLHTVCWTPNAVCQNKANLLLNSDLSALDCFTKQTQISAISIKKQGWPKKQTQFRFLCSWVHGSLCSWLFLQNKPKLETATMKTQNKANLDKISIPGMLAGNGILLYSGRNV